MIEKLKNMTKNQKIISAVIAAVVIILIIVAVVFGMNGKKTVPDSLSSVLVPDAVEEIKEEVLDVVAPLSERKKSLEEAKAINPKAYMWMSIPGTNMNYPIIFDADNDNAYWINRNLEGEEVESSGTDVKETVTYASFDTIFDADASKNIVLFGHNWNNINEPYIIGNKPEYIMMAQVPSFTDKDFASKYQYIYTNTEDEEEIWQIFSVMYSESKWPDDLGVQYIEANPNSEQFATLIDEMQNRSIFDYDISVNPDDKILTLSTCTRYYSNAGDTQRLVVVAKRLGSEDKKDSPCEVTINEDVKAPPFS